MVAAQDSHYLRAEDAHAHDVLLAVQTQTQVDDQDRLSMKADDFSLLSPEQMTQKFADIPEALENSVRISDRCNVEIVLDKIQLPEFPLPTGHDAITYLRELATKGLHHRYGDAITDTIRERLAFELEVIEKTASQTGNNAKDYKCNSHSC